MPPYCGLSIGAVIRLHMLELPRRKTTISSSGWVARSMCCVCTAQVASASNCDGVAFQLPRAYYFVVASLAQILHLYVSRGCSAQDAGGEYDVGFIREIAHRGRRRHTVVFPSTKSGGRNPSLYGRDCGCRAESSQKGAYEQV